MHDYPYYKIYPGDEMRRTSGLSLEARGLYHCLRMIAHDCSLYGHLQLDGKPISDVLLCRKIACDLEEFKLVIKELESMEAVERNGDGVIVFKDMVDMDRERLQAVNRKRRQRDKPTEEKEKKKECHGDVTPDVTVMSRPMSRKSHARCHGDVTPHVTVPSMSMSMSMSEESKSTPPTAHEEPGSRVDSHDLNRHHRFSHRHNGPKPNR